MPGPLRGVLRRPSNDPVGEQLKGALHSGSQQQGQGGGSDVVQTTHGIEYSVVQSVHGVQPAFYALHALGELVMTHVKSCCPWWSFLPGHRRRRAHAHYASCLFFTCVWAGDCTQGGRQYVGSRYAFATACSGQENQGHDLSRGALQTQILNLRA